MVLRSRHAIEVQRHNTHTQTNRNRISMNIRSSVRSSSNKRKIRRRNKNGTIKASLKIEMIDENVPSANWQCGFPLLARTARHFLYCSLFSGFAIVALRYA